MSSTTIHTQVLNHRFARLSPRSASRVLSPRLARHREALRASVRAAAVYEAAHTAASRRAALAQFQADLAS